MLNIHGYVSNDSQEWRGLFRGPFVLQTFAAHFSCIDGAVRIPSLHGNDKPGRANGGLGLAAASVCAVCRACSIVLTIDRWRGLYFSLLLGH